MIFQADEYLRRPPGTATVTSILSLENAVYVRGVATFVLQLKRGLENGANCVSKEGEIVCNF